MIKAGMYSSWKKSRLTKWTANVAGEAFMASSPSPKILSFGCTLESPVELEKHTCAKCHAVLSQCLVVFWGGWELISVFYTRSPNKFKV